MNNFWKGIIVLCASIVAAHSLTCRRCPIGILGTCLLSSDVKCDNATENCYTGNAKFNGTSTVSLHSRGCLNRDLCNQTLTTSFLGVGVTSSLQCCTTDLCNGATSVQLPLTVALCAGILSSMWGFWEL